MASGYGISVNEKDLLVVAGLIVVILVIAVYLIHDIPDVAANAIDATATATGNVFNNLTGETFGQTVTDDYNYFAGWFD
jgi:hypothetical protein